MKGIKQLDSGQWQADIRKVGFPRVRRNFRTKTLATTWKTKTLAAMESGTYKTNAEVKAEEARASGIMTLRESTQKYLDEVTALKTPKSIEFETGTMNMLRTMSFIDLPLPEITKSHIQDFYRYLRVERKNIISSANRKLTPIIHMFNKAKSWHIPEIENKSNPAEGIKESLGPGGGRRKRTFRGDEEAIFIDALGRCENQYIKPIFILARETGMRRREILENLWLNVYIGNMSYIHIHAEIAKTRVARDCPLSPMAVEAIETLRTLSGGKGNLVPITTRAFIEAWKKTQKRAAKAGVTNFQFRDLRHVALTRLSKIYPRAQDLARISGHDKLDTLLTYYEDDIETQCEIMRNHYKQTTRQ